MNSAMNEPEADGTPEMGKQSIVLLESSEVLAMRHRLHELANVFTGVMIAGALLSQKLDVGSLRNYAIDICEGSERGGVLVRELRGQLLAACGELEAMREPGAIEAAQGEHGIL
jgi:hypothetical protein